MLYDNSGEKPLLIDAGGKKMKTAKEIVLKKDVAKVSAALRRAAKQARKKAVQTHTPLVIYEDGRVKRKMVVEG